MKTNIPSSRFVVVLIFCCVLSTTSSVSAEKKTDESRMEYIQNDFIKLGVNLNLGGSITYISSTISGPEHGKNIVNNWDWGRQIQMSFFSDPRPYIENGQRPAKHWEHIGWNPIQAGDDFGNGSKVIEFEKKAQSLYVKCIPMQWPLNNVPGECTYESWIELNENTVHVRSRLNNARSDKTQYMGRHQELPAVYTNGEYYRLMTYRGDQPFTGDTITRIPKKTGGGFPWKYWRATENWAALVNEADWGLGIYKADNYLFIGGFAGDEGAGGTHDSPTGYIAPLHTEIIDHNITYDYEYTLILGSMSEIRAYAVEQGKGAGLPNWQFDKDRQHWHFRASNRSGVDAGWPIAGYIELDLGKEEMTAISPPTFWQAEEAPVLHIQAAFKTHQNKSIVSWTKHDTDKRGPSLKMENNMEFDIIGDGEYRTYTLDLSSAPSYKGPMSYLMFQTVHEPEEGAWVRVKRIWLEAP